jgi:two-component system, OmpR family, sensor histidine kinase VicK
MSSWFRITQTLLVILFSVKNPCLYTSFVLFYLSSLKFSSNKTTERTDVIYSSENVIDTILQFLSKANTISSCGDYKAPLAIIEVKEYRKLLFELKKRGIKLRYITDITKDNVKYCKELMNDFAFEIRHVDGIKANFSISETEYLASATLVEEGEELQQPMRPIQQVIYSNIKDIVEQQKYVFESFWNKAIPAESRIREIEEEGFVLGSTEVIQTPSRTKELFIDLIKSAKEEVLLLLPTTNAFLREERIGIIQLLREAAAERRVNVRILTPINNNMVEKIAQNIMADQAKNKFFDIQAIETTSSPEIAVVGTVTILVADRKQSLVIEKTDDSKEDFVDAVGLATYSTSKPTVLSYISIFDSLSKQVKLYEELKTHGKMQEEFINVASHELRTPTQSVLAYSELLRRHPERRDEMIQAIYRNAERLQRLTNDILDVTRIESQTLKLNKEKFNLSDLLSNIVQDYKNNIEKSNGNVRLSYNNQPNKDSFIVEADRERITQVISNLLNNAIKFTEETRGYVYVATEEMEKADQKVVVVTIKDTGIGIDPEILPRLFTKFATKSNTGTGLGLFISKSIIEAHGGRIWAENNKDGKGGSTFAFSLPLSKQQQEQRQLILSDNKVDSTDQ